MRQTEAQRAARRRLYATDAQVAYLKTLLDQAFAQRIDNGTNMDRHHLKGVHSDHASQAIATLKIKLGLGKPFVDVEEQP